jgi:hypothetical protein
MDSATGRFKVISMEEEVSLELKTGVKITRANGSQQFEGGIEGGGSVEWVMAYLPDGTARFVGLQRIHGSIGGRAGSLLFEAAGTHDGERSKGSWTVIAGSGTDELTGIHGMGTFMAPGGPEATYDFEYEAP